MRLHCPECGSEVLAGDISLNTMTAKCARCNDVFSYADKLPAPASTQSIGATSISKPVLLPKPPRMVVEDFGGQLKISWRWFTWSYMPLAGFLVFWDGFLVFWYFLAFKTHGPLIMKLFPILHLAVGVTLTYRVLCGFFNRTGVDVANGELAIRHFPFPWWGNRRIPTGNIQQLYCERAMSRNSNSSNSYQLSATMGEGSPIRLLGGFEHLAEPKYLEQLIEKKLRITPQAVVGEATN